MNLTHTYDSWTYTPWHELVGIVNILGLTVVHCFTTLSKVLVLCYLGEKVLLSIKNVPWPLPTMWSTNKKGPSTF